jgi:hypothetical protein
MVKHRLDLIEYKSSMSTIYWAFFCHSRPAFFIKADEEDDCLALTLGISQESFFLFDTCSSPVSSVDGGSHQEQVLVEIFP